MPACSTTAPSRSASSIPVIGDPRYRMAPSGLAGDPPDPRAIPSGCPFHPRCARATDECTTWEAELRRVAANRVAACIHVEDGA